jgi:3-deoxy-D-manno-octulosonic-acid transferase
LEKLKLHYPSYKILLTFFSPSGYEVQKNYNGADFIFYLPMDSFNHAKKFISITKPALVIFVKYDFWFYYLKEIYKNKIPLLLISGTFRKDQPFFHWYGSLHRRMLGFFQHLFVQDENSQTLLSNIGFKKVTTAGDTRFDRVSEIAKTFIPIPHVQEFCNGATTIVAGSTWPADEKKIQSALEQLENNIRLIIAPHEINVDHLNEIKKLFPGCMFYSDLKNGNKNSSNILVIDNIGMLSRLYKYATITYVGGGFTKDGIHNILEAAVFDKPVIFGPNYKKYREAIELISTGGAITFGDKNNDANDLAKILQRFIINKEMTDQMGKRAGNYIQQQTGASQKILNYIQEKRLLTN